MSAHTSHQGYGRGKTTPVLSAADEHIACTVYSLCGDDREDTDMQKDHGIFAVLLKKNHGSL